MSKLFNKVALSYQKSSNHYFGFGRSFERNVWLKRGFKTRLSHYRRKSVSFPVRDRLEFTFFDFDNVDWNFDFIKLLCVSAFWTSLTWLQWFCFRPLPIFAFTQTASKNATHFKVVKSDLKIIIWLIFQR